MRRLTGLMAGVAAAATMGAALPAHAQPTVYGIDWTCGYEGGKTFVERMKRANEDDLSCLAGAGFWLEVLPQITTDMGSDSQRLRQLLKLILEDDPMARAFFEAELTDGETTEAIMWLLVANGEKGVAQSSRRTRNDAVNLFISLPPWAREEFSDDLAEALLAEGDSRAAMTLATALKIVADNKDQLAQAAMIRARVSERYGTVDEAVAYYEEAHDLGNDRLAAEAELRKIALMWRTGYIQTDEAVAVLEELVTVWRGERLGANITLALARAYYFDQQLPQALRLLVGIAGSHAPEEIRTEAERRIDVIAEDLFVRRTDPATIGDLMDVYELIRPMMSEPGAFWMGDLRLSGVLVEAGLMARAEVLMATADPEGVAEAGGMEALLDAAALMVAFDDRAAARGFVAAIDKAALTDDTRPTYERLQARSLEVEDLGTLLVAGLRRDVLDIITARAWGEEAYGLYARARAYSDEDRSWKEPTADYLARGARMDRETAVEAEDVRLRALSSAPQPSVHHAEDLRPLLEPSAEVVGLAATLTRIGQDLSEDGPEAEQPAEGTGAKDET